MRGCVAAGFTLVLLTAGCETLPTATKTESELLPDPGARVELKEVRNDSGQSFDVDAVALLREAMDASLREGVLAWEPGSPGTHFTLSIAIRAYRPGNAFQRWLVPGWGATVLAVEGALRDAASGALAATVIHERSVYVGGGFTIGAWRNVFGWVADDIAADLRVRIERGGEFVVSVTPRADQPATAEPRSDALAVRVASVSDARAERGRIGEREAAFGVSMGDVHLSRRVPELMREVLTDELWAAGVRVVDSGERDVLDASVRRFWVHTDTTPLFWDVVAEIELELTVRTPGALEQRRDLACRQEERTWVWPSAALLGRVLDACLAELGTKIKSDELWPRGRRSGLPSNALSGLAQGTSASAARIRRATSASSCAGASLRPWMRIGSPARRGIRCM
jgi:hypothetical protein